MVAYTDLGEPPIPAELTVLGGQKFEAWYALDEVRVLHLVEFHSSILTRFVKKEIYFTNMEFFSPHQRATSSFSILSETQFLCFLRCLLSLVLKKHVFLTIGMKELCSIHCYLSMHSSCLVKEY
jgi:hypothetical protein